MHSFTLSLLLAFLPALGSAQVLTGSQPQQRTALLEEFTAVRCGNCPAAHTVAASLASTYGDAMVTIAVHGGGLAVPLAGQPDFRTVDGTALWQDFNVFAQPQGMVNRGSVQLAAQWGPSTASVIAQASPVNIGAASSFDPVTRALTVDVELYYTATRGSDDLISVVLTEDHISGYQQDYVNGAHSAYDHRHVMREHITPVAGDPVVAPQPFDLVQRSYTFVVPLEWSISALEVVAFVAEVDGEVWQAKALPASGGATAVRDDQVLKVGPAFPVPASDLVHIPLSLEEPATLYIRDAFGRVVHAERVSPGGCTVALQVGALPAGPYSYSLDGQSEKRLVVLH